MKNTPGITPMMTQYLDIKSGCPDALLFYRMGDFYELFFDDAEAASTALDITLTKRGKHQGADIPMCGVPAHSAEGYLLTLIRKGFKVAVCEQTESPSEARKRGSKSVVNREIVRLVTPGTLTEESLLDTRCHNYLASYAEIRGEGAIAWTDLSTGDFTVAPCPRVSFGPMLARLLPSEVLVEEAIEQDLHEPIRENGAVITPLASACFDSTIAERRLMAAYNVGSLDSFAPFQRPEISALGAIVDYLEITQRGKSPHLSRPRREAPGKQMQIDAATRRNLELTRSLTGSREGSLLATIDQTQTSAGARLLERRLSSPSTDIPKIRSRQDMIAFFFDDPKKSRDLRQLLQLVPDLERAMARLALDRGGPRDLAMVRDALSRAADILTLIDTADTPTLVATCLESLRNHDRLVQVLDSALVANPPVLGRDGGFIATGHSEELDETRRHRDDGRSVVASLQSNYADVSGISSLKIKHNNVLGYFVETTATHAEKMLALPLSDTFIHRQTTANAVRFTTLDLSEAETRLLNAGRHALELEKSIFDTLRDTVLGDSVRIHDAARSFAEIDLANSLADLARSRDWVRPLVDESNAFEIEAGRHPVVERALLSSGQSFVSNNCDLSADNPGSHPVWLITGPNMAGKSTFLRQNALIALLAQTGSWVPAKSAKIGTVDQLFSRVGAADDLARGRSTFMVEMVETAAIVNQAGERALVILDEIGRGTATYDGLSIAWAVLEHLHDTNRCRALFATHYHELTALSEVLDGLRNATMAVREWNGDVVFLHEVRNGAADRSYGVHVAQLAGLPPDVVNRARTILDTLEQGERDRGGKTQKLIDDLPLFSHTTTETQEPEPSKQFSPISERLGQIKPDDLSPREALAMVYELCDMLK